MTQEHCQPELEGFSQAYTPQPGDTITREKYEYFASVVAQVRAEAGDRYRARERERLSTPLSPEAQARRRRMKRLLRPLGAN